MKFFDPSGREVSMEGFFGGMHDAVLGKAFGSLKTRLEAIRCETHGQSPTVNLSANGDNEAQFTIAGCCEDLKTKVREAARKMGVDTGASEP